MHADGFNPWQSLSYCLVMVCKLPLGLVGTCALHTAFPQPCGLELSLSHWIARLNGSDFRSPRRPRVIGGRLHLILGF